MKMYLLGGNGSQANWFDYTIPNFSKYDPYPVELPGFGSNTSEAYQSLDQLAGALIDITEENSEIFCVGVNGLVVLRALVLEPGHFSKVYMLAPVGAFLWKRKFVKFMRIKPFRKIIHWLLRRNARLFSSRFTSENWIDDKFDKITDGYRNCQAFQKYFDFVNNYDSLKLVEWIETEIELIWGTKDGVLDFKQAIAWDSILPRADLKLTIKEDWGHYPYLDDPLEFAETLENFEAGMVMHSKAGRLQLASLAGLDVPKASTVNSIKQVDMIPLQQDKRYAVRSSSASEDQIDATQAGKYTTYLNIAPNKVRSKVDELLETELDEVVVQEYIDPIISGVAFVRNISKEIEFVEGHLEEMVDGSKTPYSLILSDLSDEWQAGTKEARNVLEQNNLPVEMLHSFLDWVLESFHYQPGDIEWAFDGTTIWFLQYRPMQSYQWRRVLTSANLDEILPQQVSKIMEHAQRKAAYSISRIYELWDHRVLEDNEPFTAIYNGASYVNMDLFLSRFYDWGLPSTLLSDQIGGSYPEIRFNLPKFLFNIPIFLKMLLVSRKKIFDIERELIIFEKELDKLIATNTEDRQFVKWFVRYYVFIVQTNILINAMISSAGGSFLSSKTKTLYSDLSKDAIHRVPWESDPASSRKKGDLPERLEFPKFGILTAIYHRLGLPGFGGKYYQIREWFRDSNMRLFYKLHFAMEGSDWLKAHSGKRDRTGTFWQSGEDIGQQTKSVVIYPGKVSGILGEDIMVVHALEPGHIEIYKQKEGVIAKSGGKLSHGATLLREIEKPSAIITHIDEDLIGKEVVLDNGKILIV